VAIRAADDDDRESIIEWLTVAEADLSNGWVLEPVEGDREALRSLCAWRCSVALDLGLVLMDEHGRPIGGVSQPFSKRARAALYRRTLPRVASIEIGPWLYPADLPTACNARLAVLAQATQTILPSRPLERITFGLVADGSPPGELWAAWLNHAGTRPTSVRVVDSPSDPMKIWPIDGFVGLNPRPEFAT
jgi:hypothetical protein